MDKQSSHRQKLFAIAVSLCLLSVSFQAQTTGFTYQGKLSNNGAPAIGNYDFEFRLFDALSGGAQRGTTQTLTNVPVTSGVFSVQLDFGACSACFDGTNRFLDITVRVAGGGAFTPLTPRQEVTSNPYAIKSLNAATADGLSAACASCVTSSQIQSVDGSAVTGAIPVASVPAGSGNYIQNTSPSQGSSFDITGNGVVGGNLGVGTTSPGFKLEVNDAANTGLRVQTNTAGGTVASFGGFGAFNIDANGVVGGRLTVLENGNVGIGANNPLWKLHVFGTGITRAFVYSNSNAGFGLGLTNGPIAQPLWSLATATPGNFQIFNDVSGQNAVWINASNNNVGVGSTNPTSKLQVSGTGITRALVNSDSNAGLGLALNNQQKWSVATVTGGNFQVFNDVAGQNAIWINGSDNKVGIGTTTPQAQLDVAGDARVTGNLTVSGAVNGTVSHANTTTNMALLGMLRWDLLGPKSFAVGSTPIGAAFDGANIWVTNFSSNNVTKLRASDGASLGTFAVSLNPRGIAFDGANIWVAENGSNLVTKLRPSDGAFISSFTVGNGPMGVAFDGANIWVVNNQSSTLTKLRASDGVTLGTFASGGLNPREIAFDGANIWVTNSGSNNVAKLRASDGANLGAFPVGIDPAGVAFDGANIWVANRGSNNVGRLRASDGAGLGVFPTGSFPIGVAFDGANIWVTNGGNFVTKLRTSDGANLGTFLVGGDPRGIVFDGANVWVTNNASDNVTKLVSFSH